jgi:hypothetical protein
MGRFSGGGEISVRFHVSETFYFPGYLEAGSPVKRIAVDHWLGDKS